MNDNNLSAELQIEIEQKAKDGAENKRKTRVPAFAFGYEDGYYAGATEYAIWKVRYDELKAEHAALKEREQGLVDALDEIIDMSNADKTLSHIDSHVAQRARTALQSWNQGKEGGV